MRKSYKRKFAVQAASFAVAAVAVANVPMLAVRPPVQFSCFLALAAFALGVIAGVGFSHWFEVTEEEVAS